eukprot:2607172-Ditylum_brightwellii.AAC.1
MEKQFLCGNILAVLPVSKTGWGKVLQLHNSVYESKKQTIELLCRCFATLYCSKVSTGSPTMPQE